MIEHPVPQNITEYQFHLIGNMTIKQFLVLLGGVGLAFLFYSTNLPGIIKWPFVIVMVGGAGALAFVPYEERTLDQWLVNFIRAIYRPTKYYWRRLAPTPGYYTYESSANARKASSQESAQQPQRQQQVRAYLSSIAGATETPAAADPLDLFHNESSDINTLFDSVAAAENVEPGQVNAIEKPNLQVRARPLGSKRGLVFNTTETTVQKQANFPATNKPNGTSRFKNTDPNSTKTFSLDHSAKQKTPTAGVPNHPSGRAQTTDINTVTVKKSPAPAPQQAPVTPTSTTSSPPVNVPTESTSSTKNTAVSTVPVIFNNQLPFPSVPQKPNLLLGMVHDTEGNIIPGSIVEILDENNHTVRAMKTNNLGQFYISTPLKKGHYRIETEATNHTFPVYSLELNDTVLDPIDIKAA